MSSIPKAVPCPPLKIPVRIMGSGSFLPEEVVGNEEIAAACGVDPELIFRRTGQRERRRAAPSDATSDLATRAAQAALDRAGVTAEDIGLIICATCSPDHAFPSTAALIAHQLKAGPTAAFDLEAGCAGFVYGLVMGAQHVAAGLARRVLVVGADVMSRLVARDDPSITPIFGDGAGAVVLGPGEDEGFESITMGSDGSGADLLSLPAGGSRQPVSAGSLGAGEHVVSMRGPALYRQAVRYSTAAAAQVLADAEVDADSVDLVIPHQSSLRLVSATARACGVPMERVMVNLERHGNTATASIPIALDEALRTGRVGRGSRLLLLSFGAGLSWAAGLMRL